MTDELTPFTESNALLAMIRHDQAEVRRYLSMMTGAELRTLRAAAFHLSQMISDQIYHDEYEDSDS